MAKKTQPNLREQAQQHSELERDLAGTMEEQKNEMSVILSFLEHMATQERRASIYVTSYPACNSEA